MKICNLKTTKVKVEVAIHSGIFADLPKTISVLNFLNTLSKSFLSMKHALKPALLLLGVSLAVRRAVVGEENMEDFKAVCALL